MSLPWDFSSSDLNKNVKCGRKMETVANEVMSDLYILFAVVHFTRRSTTCPSAALGTRPGLEQTRGTRPAPAGQSRFWDCRSPKVPRPFVLRSHRRGKFQFVLNVGTKTTLSRSGGSSEACRPWATAEVSRACKTRADPIRPAGDRNDGKTAMGMRPWGFSFSGTKAGVG